jgi:hypothetical protein
MMLRRRALDAVGGFDTRLSFTADWEMWLRLARRGCRFAGIAAPVAMYRMHRRSMTRNLDHAIADAMRFLEHSFTDGAEFRIMMYLARLCLHQLDEPRARDCLQRAVRQAPAALDTFDFYESLAAALAREGRPDGHDVPREIRMLLSLTTELDTGPAGPRPERQALRHLAAGHVARNGGEWRRGVRHLGLALHGSWRTVLQWSFRRVILRLLLPAGLVARGRRMLAAAGVLRRPESVPAIVRAALDAERGR